MYEAWKAALDGIVIRHPDPLASPELELVPGEPPMLNIRVANSKDTVTGERRPLAISSISLTYFPGAWLARAWLAAGWSGYIQHEALEEVLYHGVRPLDPHEPPFTYDRGLRWGLPPVLTPESLFSSLLVVMPEEVARRVIDAANDCDHPD